MLCGGRLSWNQSQVTLELVVNGFDELRNLRALPKYRKKRSYSAKLIGLREKRRSGSDAFQASVCSAVAGTYRFSDSENCKNPCRGLKLCRAILTMTQWNLGSFQATISLMKNCNRGTTPSWECVVPFCANLFHTVQFAV